MCNGSHVSQSNILLLKHSNPLFLPVNEKDKKV